MKTFIKVLLVMMYASITYSQPVMWQRVYDNSDRGDHGRDILQTYDGGYLICGITTNPISIYLIKTNNLGIKEWEKTISESPSSLVAVSIQQTSDSGYVMTGSRTRDLCIVRTDKNGNLLWKKYFNRPGGEAIGRSIRITDDGGFIACGELFILSSSIENAYVIKTDSLGNLQWEKLLGDSLVSYGTDIVQTQDGYYYVTGHSRLNFSNPVFPFMIKMDYAGNKIWGQNFNSYNFLTKILYLPSNNLIITGVGYPFGVFFSKVDTSGNILLQRVIPTSNPEFYFGAMCINSSQEIIIGAKERFPEMTGTTDFSAAIVDTSGNLISQKRLNTPKNFDDNCYAVKATSDNGYIFVGDTEYLTSMGNKDNILVAKTDSLFNTTPVVKIAENSLIIEKNYALFQNYPNPFNSSTTITYQLKNPGFVSLKITDMLGREISVLINKKQLQGQYTISFNGNNLVSGLYFMNFYVNSNFIDNKKILLLK